MQDKEPFIQYKRLHYRGFWWLNDASSQGISTIKHNLNSAIQILIFIL